MKRDFGIGDCVRLKHNSVNSFPYGAGEFFFMSRGLFGCINITNETYISYVRFHLCTSSLPAIKYISNEYSALIQFSLYVKTSNFFVLF